MLVHFCVDNQYKSVPEVTYIYELYASLAKLLQMKSFFQTALLFLISFILFSCNDKKEKGETIESWYNKIKNEILENSKQKEDSVSFEKKDETLYITYFLKGKKLRQEYRSLDTSRLFAITKYGQNDLFELRSEIHKNGQKATEGITYSDNYYGPWTVWYDNGQIMYQGYRFENNDFGTWTYYTETGTVQKIEDNKKPYFADSILNKQSLHTTGSFASAGGDE
jgi:antitoxin component YwqK of YwqJK toxin-antitoxin module